MDFQLEFRDGRLVAAGDMTIYQAAAMKAALLSTWPQGTAEVALDLTGVTELDTCGLQIVLLLKRRADDENRSLTIVALSAAAREVFDLCGLRSLYSTAVVPEPNRRTA